MKLITPFAIGLFLSLSSLSQINDFKKDSSILRDLEFEWLSAEFKLDTATISKLMDDSFISIDDNSVSNKQQEIDGTYKNISERIKNNHIVDSLYFDDVQIRIYGTTAIVTYLSVTMGRIKGVPFSNRRTRIYDVWIKKNNEWKAVSSQITPIR